MYIYGVSGRRARACVCMCVCVFGVCVCVRACVRACVRVCVLQQMGVKYCSRQTITTELRGLFFSFFHFFHFFFSLFFLLFFKPASPINQVARARSFRLVTLAQRYTKVSKVATFTVWGVSSSRVTVPPRQQSSARHLFSLALDAKRLLLNNAISV